MNLAVFISCGVQNSTLGLVRDWVVALAAGRVELPRPPRTGRETENGNRSKLQAKYC